MHDFDVDLRFAFRDKDLLRNVAEGEAEGVSAEGSRDSVESPLATRGSRSA